MLARDVKLIPHRWDMHVIQALGNRDHELLARIFTELQIAGGINSRVKTFGFGATAQFHSYGAFLFSFSGILGFTPFLSSYSPLNFIVAGFFDKRSSPPGCSTASLDYVVENDTLLLISLRNCDLLSAKVLIEAGASLTDANIIGETPIQQLFNAYATIKLAEKERLQSTDPSASPHDVTRTEGNRILNQQLDFQALFVLTQKQVDSFYDTLKAKIRLELEQIYEEYAPERIAKLQKQLDDFEFKEQLLLESVRRKYLSSS